MKIIGRKSKGYTSDYSFAATKIAMKNKDLPLTLNTVTKELITDRQAFQLGEVMKNVNGVSPSSYYNQYNIRESVKMKKDRSSMECVPGSIIFYSQ